MPQIQMNPQNFAIKSADWGQSAAQAGQQIGQLGRTIKQYSDEADAKELAAQQQAAHEENMEQGYSLYESGDREGFQSWALRNPEAAKPMNEHFQFKDEQTKANFLEGERAIALGADPVKTYQDRFNYLKAKGLDTTQTSAQLMEAMNADEAGMDALRKESEFGLIAADPKAYAEWQKGRLGGGDSNNAAAQSYRFWQSIKDPAKKDAYGKKEGFVPRDLAPDTSVIQTPTGYNVIDGAGGVVDTVVIPAKEEEYQQKQAQRDITLRQLELDENEQNRKTKIERQKEEDSIKASLSTSTTALDLVTDLLGSDIDAVTGAFDRWTPTLMSSSQDIIDKGNALKSALTLDNLSKMSGVLTDKDIQLLAQEATGLNIDDDGFTGSEKLVKGQLKKIKNSLLSKLKVAVSRGDMTQEQFDTIELSTMTREELEQIANGG